MTEQLTLAESNVVKTYDKMRKLHEYFRVVADADAMIRKGLANRTASPTGMEALFAGDEDSSLGAYVEVVDRVQVCMYACGSATSAFPAHQAPCGHWVIPALVSSTS